MYIVHCTKHLYIYTVYTILKLACVCVSVEVYRQLQQIHKIFKNQHFPDLYFLNGPIIVYEKTFLLRQR